MPTKLKYAAIFEDLLGNIQDGKFQATDQIPSERALAAKYGVTRTTARRALTHLTEMGLVERRGAQGTVLRTGRSGKMTVSLVCAAVSRTDIEEFLQQGICQARQRKWEARVVRMERHDEAQVLRALSIGNPCIMLGQPVAFRPNGPLQRALKQASARIVVIGTRMDFLGVASIIGDDAAGITLACEHLRKMGHTRVAFVRGATPPGHPTMQIEFESWRRGFADVMDDHIAAANDVTVSLASSYESVAFTAYAAVKSFLKSDASQQTTALLCLGREISDGAVAAARDVGRPIPQSLSILQYGGTRDWPIYNPPRDCVDVHMDGHIETALNVLERNMNNRPTRANVTSRTESLKPENLYLVRPTLHCRGSVRRIE